MRWLGTIKGNYLWDAKLFNEKKKLKMKWEKCTKFSQYKKEHDPLKPH